jgi:hypothetical protein
VTTFTITANSRACTREAAGSRFVPMPTSVQFFIVAPPAKAGQGICMPDPGASPMTMRGHRSDDGRR